MKAAKKQMSLLLALAIFFACVDCGGTLDGIANNGTGGD